MTKANKGVAALKEGDAESDSNEKGNGNFVDEYTDNMNGKCSVIIRIGLTKIMQTGPGLKWPIVLHKIRVRTRQRQKHVLE